MVVLFQYNYQKQTVKWHWIFEVIAVAVPLQDFEDHRELIVIGSQKYEWSLQFYGRILWKKETIGSKKKCKCSNGSAKLYFKNNQLLNELLFVLSFIPLLCLHVLVGFYFFIFCFLPTALKNGTMEMYYFQVEA